jgi:hypothetical protein
VASDAEVPSFDAEAYIRWVREVSRQGPDSSLPPLVRRYALDAGFTSASDSEIQRRVGQVVQLWHRQAETTTSLGETCRRFLAADDQLRRSGDHDNPQWWRSQIRLSHAGGSGFDLASPFGGDRRPLPKSPSKAKQRSAPPATARGGQSPPTSGSAASTAQPDLGKPTGLKAEMLDDRVVLSWLPPPNAPPGTTYAVERIMGDALKRLKPTSNRSSAEDLQPAVGRPLRYRVVAEHADSGGRSDSQAITVIFAPPITGLAARQARDGGVRGQWIAHADLHKLRVWRSSEMQSTNQQETVPIEAERNSFHDPQPQVGRYIYTVIPFYRDPSNGKEHQGPPTTIKVAVLALPPEPRFHTTHDREVSDRGEVELRWDELPDNTTLLLIGSTAEPSGDGGEILLVEEAEALGEVVASGLAGTARLVELPAGRWTIVPFAVSGSRAVRGKAMHVDVVPPITSLEVIRTGPDVSVSWIWPKGLKLARIIWHANGAAVSSDVTHHEFQRHGSISFTRREAASIEITGVIQNGLDVITSKPVVAQVPEQPPTLTYNIYGVRRYFGLLPWRGWRRVVITTDLPCTCFRAEIYAHCPGSRQPDIILTVMNRLELIPHQGHEVTVILPRREEMDRPYYITFKACNANGPMRVDSFSSGGREIP